MPTGCRLEFSQDVYEPHLSLALLTLQILVSTEGCCSSKKNEDVETDAHTRRLIRGDRLGSSRRNLRRWIALLFKVCQKQFWLQFNCEGLVKKHTVRFKLPTSSPWRISRASSL